MPARATRRAELHQHLVRAHAGRAPELVRARRLHPEWPQCAAGCGWPVDPAALAGGWDTHPGCGRARPEPRPRAARGRP